MSSNNIKRYKYPRTPHLPWSSGGSSDDVRCCDVSQFEGKQVIVTEKMDGENTSLYCDYIHARSIDSRHHASRDWVKALHASIATDIPVGWRICGENLFAKHAIGYDQLPSYFMAFSIWDEQNYCLSWAETKQWFELLNLTPPPVLYQGEWNKGLIRQLKIDTSLMEGYVVRISENFHYKEFAQSVAKWVRKSHVQTEEHWMHTAVVANKLLSNEVE
ncbi:RNA ligase family protein [Zooshikella harenae]|uniref:RNA ligase family protein n=1 Tax=Zooshikella harenae TaxID=2827238 RepID=A0ABS5ZBT0_9GAMM|nr:RNA ligase family protein [Zooshikella harenae]MBU2711449.1 RNA ligase family protein [Zooshikella harenae]